MAQKYKVYINDKVVIFRNSKYIPKAKKDQMIYINPSKAQIVDIISFLKTNDEVNELYFLSKDPEETFSLFAKNYLIISAAGGLVRDESGNLLFIFRNNKWDLPKGKIDQGEMPQNAAIREVREETGLKTLKIIRKITSTLHVYTEKDHNILKKTLWYEMLSDHKEPTNPQTEENITEIKWFSVKNTEIIFKNTYKSIEWVLEKYIKHSLKSGSALKVIDRFL